MIATAPRPDRWGSTVVVACVVSAGLHVAVGTLVVGGDLFRRLPEPVVERVYTVELTGGFRPGGVAKPRRAPVAPVAKKPAPTPPAPKPIPKGAHKPAPKPKPAAKPAPKPAPKPPPAKAMPAPQATPKPAKPKPAKPKPAPTPKAAAQPPPTPPVDDAYTAAAARWRTQPDAPPAAPGPLGTGGGDGGGGEVVGAEFIEYLELVNATIRERWVTSISDASLQAVVRFEIARNGTVSNIRLYEPSGDRAYDAAALRAVRQISRLPPPPPRYASEFREFQVVFKPDEVP